MATQVNYGNGNLGGKIQTNDGIVGLVMTGVTESGGYTLGTAILVNSMSDVAAAGITVGNNPFAFKQLNDFYLGVSGPTTLFVMLVPSTMTVANMADKTNASGASKLLNFAINNGTPVRNLGVISDDTVVTVGSITAGLNPDCYTAANNMKLLVAQYQASQNPFRGIVGGTSYTGVPSALTAMGTGTSNNACCMLIGDNSIAYSTKGAAIGQWLAARSQLPVQRLVSRIKNGPQWNQVAYLASVEFTATNTDAATIAGKGYITWKTQPNSSSLYFSKEVTLTVSTDDYYLLTRGLIADKANVIATTIFNQDEDDEVLTVPGTGLIDPGYAGNLDSALEKSIALNMVGNISGVLSFTDPTQNIVETNNVVVELTLYVNGYAFTIIVNLALGQ